MLSFAFSIILRLILAEGCSIHDCLTYQFIASQMLIGLGLLTTAALPSDNVSSWDPTQFPCRARNRTLLFGLVLKQYIVPGHTVSQLVWLRQFLSELSLTLTDPLIMFCDNLIAISIASNHVFHELTKHIVIDCHFLR